MINGRHAETGAVDLEVYASGLARNGTRLVAGPSRTFWVRYESLGMMLIPAFALNPPSRAEVTQVLWHGPACVATYLLEPDASHPANAWLYVCADHTYHIDRLAPVMRRNVRRGLKELNVAWLLPEQLLSHGVTAYCDTRRRVGLGDGTPAEFIRRFVQRSRCPGHVFLGAWKDDKLAAFLSIAEVDDWAEIEGCFSADALLETRPNDTLMHAALFHYMVEEGRRIVSYGASSIQEARNAQGLHAFKTKVGFQAKPVHRVFLLHPLLRPFANRFAILGVKAMRGLFPRNRLVNKASGVLDILLGNGRTVQAVTGGHHDN